MTCLSMPAKGKGCAPLKFAECRTLKAMVDLFLRERSDRQEREALWWGDQNLSTAQACRRAMFALENEELRDGHQWIFSKKYLKEMGDKIADHAKSLEAVTSFGDLYFAVECALNLKRNQKPLLVYDVAWRLGRRFGLEPEEVYLHAGLRAGANALKPRLGQPRSRPLGDFPTSIRARLTPAQAEDFLCLAAKYLREDLWD